ncbi:MAG: MAPEG family protein [Pseudomonadota bacterium]
MSPELYWMAATAVATALMWVPYILGFITTQGLVPALTARVGDDVGELGWCQRAQRAHLNAIENLVIFAPLAIGVHVAGAGTETTALAAMVYFWVRIAHYVIYTLGIPVIRTLIFAVGVICQLALGFALLGAVPASA